MSVAGLSVDVDSVSTHLEGYGFSRPPDDGAAYRLAVPRAMETFARAGARATFFLIAEEAARYPDVVRNIVDSGHEVACHSMTHQLPFVDLPAAELDREVRGAKALLEQLTGVPVLGFRAPSWDTGDVLLAEVAAAGFEYDASSFPSLLLPVLRWSVARRSATGRVRTRSGYFDGVFGPTTPHRRSVGGRTIVEVPIATTPGARLPYYHTLRYLLPSPAFRFIGAWTRLRRGPVTYQFHAVDFLEVARDGLDPRIARHPGMDRDLEAKLALASRSLAELRPRTIVPLADLVMPWLTPNDVPNPSERISA